MRIRWTPRAADDLENIFHYLVKTAPNLARPTIVEIHQAIRSLKTFPNLGRPGIKPGTRELLHNRLPYIITYRLKDDAVEVLYIRHPAQDQYSG